METEENPGVGIVRLTRSSPRVENPVTEDAKVVEQPVQVPKSDARVEQVSIDPEDRNKGEAAIRAHHDPRFDAVLDEAHTFVCELGLQVAPKEHIYLIDFQSTAATDIRAREGKAWRGGYYREANIAIVTQTEEGVGPITASLYNRSATIHEITHSGTDKADEYAFYAEVLPGMAECAYLLKRAEQGLYHPSSDFILERAGVEVLIPGPMRCLDAREAENVPTHGPIGSHVSQGVVAALGIALSFPSSGLTANELLTISRRNKVDAYARMKGSLDSLKPGLSREVELFPETANGIIQATALIQDEARKQGLIH
jgi:hypothetical protein